MKETAVYYLGPEETYSHHAAGHFLPAARAIACATFREAFAAAAADPGAYAAVPFENTIQGPVTEVMDLMAEHTGLHVAASLAMPIRHRLLTKDPTTAPREIHSHPQALAQCRRHLETLYPKAALIPVGSTAEAAKNAAEDPAVAAIASDETAARHGLLIRQAEIQDVADNMTRFFLLSAAKEPARSKGALPPTHTLLHITLDDAPGALVQLLTPFYLLGVNMTFIQSRPIRGENWKYAFTIEALTGICKLPLASLLDAIRPYTRTLRVLGAYTTFTAAPAVSGSEATTLATIRMMIGALDEKLVTALCARARYHRNSAAYADDGAPCTAATLARHFATEADKQILARSLRPFYIRTILPMLCAEGTDANPREALSADIDCLNALAQRFSFAMHVIARKRVELGNDLKNACESRDSGRVEAALVNPIVEEEVLTRVMGIAAEHGADTALIQALRSFYTTCVFPISRQIQVHALLDEKNKEA